MIHIRVFGADWCEDTQQTREHLDRIGVKYQYLNVDHDPQAKQFVVDHNGGKQRTPTVDIAGVIVVEPSDAELDQVLRERQIVG